jgi:hypothetical protein
MTFKLHQTPSPEENFIEIDGYIDEHAKFPYIVTAPKIRISLNGVKGLNSSGTRTWINWVNQGLPEVPVTFENCPFIFVKTFGNVVGSIPERAEVDSFFVPYISETTEEHRNVLYVRDVHFNESGVVTHPKIVDSKGNEMQADVNPTYFKFLKQNESAS